MTREKRYVEVDVNWDDENMVWYEYDGDGSYNTYSTTATLPELILKEYPKLREKIIDALYNTELFGMCKKDNECFWILSNAILSILGIKKEG